MKNDMIILIYVEKMFDENRICFRNKSVREKVYREYALI